MPWMIKKEDDMYCVHKENEDGTAGEKVKCHPSEEQAKAHMRAMYSAMENEAKKFRETLSIKAVGDWELDVLAIPFNSKDSDGQWFDENTDIMEDAFNTPLAVYQHGVEQGAKSFQEKLIVIGKAQPGTLEKKHDGWHIRIILDKTIEYAKKIMDAVKQGMVAVSSGSISHLARLEINGRKIMYEKDRSGRIAVWPFAEISLWEKGNGNMQPANHAAIALPAMKAIYRDAGLKFPEIENVTHDDLSETDEVTKCTGNIVKQARAYLLSYDE